MIGATEPVLPPWRRGPKQTGKLAVVKPTRRGSEKVLGVFFLVLLVSGETAPGHSRLERRLYRPIMGVTSSMLLGRE